MTEKKRNRLLKTLEIESLLEANCRRCPYGGLPKKEQTTCGECEIQTELETLGRELHGGEFTDEPSWTQEQDEKLVEMFSTITASEIDVILGKKKYSSKNRIDYLRKKGVNIPTKLKRKKERGNGLKETV